MRIRTMVHHPMRVIRMTMMMMMLRRHHVTTNGHSVMLKNTINRTPMIRIQIRVPAKKVKAKRRSSDSSDSDNDDSNESSTPGKRKYENNGGIVRLHEINSTKSVMIYAKLPGIEFHEFYCDQKIKTICLNFQTFNKFLKRIDKDDDVMTMILRSDKPDHLIIQNRSNTNGRKFSEYEIPLIEVNKHKNSFDTGRFESVVSMSSAQLQSLTKSITGFSDYMEIKSIGGQAQFYCKGDSGVIRETLGRATKKKDAKEKQVVVQGIFETRFIAAASKCTPLSSKVDIYLKNDWPAVFVYNFSEKSKIAFWISPVVVKPHENSSLDAQNDLSDLSDNEDIPEKQTPVKKKMAPRVSRS